MKERAGHLLQASPSNKEVMEAMQEVELRHEALATKTKKNIVDLEWLTDSLTTHQDLFSTQAEWQKEMWEKIHSYTGLLSTLFSLFHTKSHGILYICIYYCLIMYIYNYFIFRLLWK